MDNKELLEFMDQQRWLLNNGLVSDNAKNQLFFYGSIVHKNVQAIEVDIDVQTKLVNYHIYVDSSLIKKIKAYEKLSKSTDLFGMWRFKRLLKKEGVLDFQLLLNRFVKDFCGPSWSTEVNVVDFNNYVEHSGANHEVDNEDGLFNKLPDKR